jgi:hypothetical protein
MNSYPQFDPRFFPHYFIHFSLAIPCLVSHSYFTRQIKGGATVPLTGTVDLFIMGYPASQGTFFEGRRGK